MTDTTYTAIAVVVDRSGSMQSMRKDAEGGLNTFIEDQKAEPGKCTLRIDQFDTVYDNVVKSTEIAKVEKYTLTPRGGTALLDAMGKTIVDFGSELKALPEAKRPANVIVVVVTDGDENSSREWTKDAVSKLIKQQENDYGWTFVFLAANQDAIAVGASYGFHAGTSMTYDSANVGNTYATLSAKVSGTRSTGTWAPFTEEERSKSKKK